MDFIELENEVFEQVKDVTGFFPDELLNKNEEVIGCPDCMNEGGLLIQYSANGSLKSWRIDQMKNNLPEYLHGLMEMENEKISLINILKTVSNLR